MKAVAVATKAKRRRATAVFMVEMMSWVLGEFGGPLPVALTHAGARKTVLSVDQHPISLLYSICLCSLIFSSLVYHHSHGIIISLVTASASIGDDADIQKLVAAHTAKIISRA